MKKAPVYSYPGMCHPTLLASAGFYLFESDTASGFDGAWTRDDVKLKSGVRLELPEDRRSHHKVSNMSMLGNIVTIFDSRAFDL